MDRSPGELLRGYAFLVPLVLFLAAFVLAPIAGTFGGSLMQDVTFLPERFVGAENYRALLSDPGFAQALRFTVLFTAASVPLELVLGLAVALLLAHPSRARGALRACVLIPRAIPAAAETPCPSEPVATRTQGHVGVGCPSRGLPSRRRLMRSSSIAPASLSAAQRIGAAWPFDRTNTSWSRPLGSFGSNRISSKKRTETISAQDMQVVGCPEPASAVDSSEWRRSFWAMRARVA